jgi:hypothetical protein
MDIKKHGTIIISHTLRRGLDNLFSKKLNVQAFRMYFFNSN